VRLAGQGGQQHARRQRSGRQQGDGFAQHHVQVRREVVLLEYLEFATRPAVSHAAQQGAGAVGDEVPQSLAQQLAAQRLPQAGVVVSLDEIEQRRLELAAVRALRGGLCERRLIQCQHLSGAQALVQQAPHLPQPRHLLHRIAPLAAGVAHRLRKAITPLPHPQRVLGDAGFVGQGGDGQIGRFHLSKSKH
jgi:hypothetical protein